MSDSNAAVAPLLATELSLALTEAIALLSDMLVGGADDPRAVATSLIEEFGSLGAVLAGSDARLRRAIGCQPRVSKLLRSAAAGMHHVLRTRMEDRPFLATCDAVRDYFCMRDGFRSIEVIHVLYLNYRNRLIQEEEVSRGTVDQAHVYTREIIRRALEIGAVGIVLVHNHPSGDPTPSKADIALTRGIYEAARLFDIALHDHVIVGGSNLVSMRAQSLF